MARSARHEGYVETGPIASYATHDYSPGRPRIWEVIDVEIENKTGAGWTETATLRVPGGVLYRVLSRDCGAALMFVPEADRHVAADASS